MTYSKRLLGRVRLYDVNSSDSKKTLDVNPGGYGICRVNNFLIIGSCDQSLKYLNLEDK